MSLEKGLGMSIIKKLIIINMSNQRFSEQEIFDYIFRKQLLVSTEFVISYWEKKQWLTPKGYQVKTLEAAVNVCNSIVTTKMKRELGIAKYKQDILNNKKRFDAYKEQLKSKEW